MQDSLSPSDAEILKQFVKTEDPNREEDQIRAEDVQSIVGSYAIICLYNFCLLLPTVAYNAAYAVAYVLYVYKWQLTAMNTILHGRL